MAKAEGTASGYTCPRYHAVLWEQRVAGWECRTGHRFSLDELVAASVGAAINALEERASLLQRAGQPAAGLTLLAVTRALRRE